MKTKTLVMLCIAFLLLCSCAKEQEQPKDIIQDIQKQDTKQQERIMPLKGNQEMPQQGMPSQGMQQAGMQSAGIYYHTVYFATSTDAEIWTLSEEPIAEHASVPDLIQVQQAVGDFGEGTLLAYFVDASLSEESDNEQIGVIYSTDNGETWSERETVTFIGGEDHVPVDPSIVQLENGTLRLYYFDITTSRNNEKEYIFYATDSSDGKTFTVISPVYTAESLITDPDVVFFDDKWIMYLSKAGQGFLILESSDGILFTEKGSVQMAGVPGAVVTGGTVYLYSCSMGIARASSSDAISFTRTETVIEGMYCDPAPILMHNGTYAMLLKLPQQQ